MLTNEQIALRAPAVFGRPAGHMSRRYAFVPTGEVLDALRNEGFFPVSAQQDQPKRRDPMTVAHRVVLRHESHLGTTPVVGGAVPQILLLNSHNGRSQLRLRAGLYRFVCANGMVIGDDYAVDAVRHVRSIAAGAIDRAKQLAAQSGDLARSIERWGALELTETREREFAAAARELRWPTARGVVPVEELLRAHRPEDEGRSLWAVFNRVQENTTKGGLIGVTADGRRTQTRELRGIAADTEFNARLWALAAEFAR